MKAQLDHDILEAARAGDTEAISTLLIEYHPTITRFARKFCATPEDIEDAVQETLWIAYQKVGTLRVASAFVSWLFRVVRHECFRLLRLKEREETLDFSLDIRSIEGDPEQCTLLGTDITAAIAAMPAIYRQVLIMRDIEERTAPEVAAALGVSIETVKSRLHRGRNMLRQSLQHWRDVGS
jgi:RNA polymerase sigma factor (sigma-70 family)